MRLKIHERLNRSATYLGSSTQKIIQEWMDDSEPTYESHPRCSIAQWLKSNPLYDRLVAAYQDRRRRARTNRAVRTDHQQVEDLGPRCPLLAL